MNEKQTFTIDKVGWHTQTPGNTETTESIHNRFRAITAFLQENGLTVKHILGSEEQITDDLSIRSVDLTEEGLVLMKKCYDKWLQRVDQGMPPEDLSIFQKELAKLRKG
jgi:hypothetical protein